MNANECRNVRREIDESEFGQRLSEGSESHVIACVGCATFRAERNTLRQLVGGLQPVTAPADFDVRLRARIARERNQVSVRPSIFRFAMSTPAIVVAAVIVAVVAGAVWINQHKTQNPTQSATNQPATQNPSSTVATNNQTGPTSNQSAPPEATNEANAGTDDQKLASAPRRTSNKSPANVSGQSSDFSVSRAPSYQLAPDRAGEVSLTAPVKPMVVTVYDDKGGSRKIMLPPISFGAQRLTDKTTPVSMTNTRDW